MVATVAQEDRLPLLREVSWGDTNFWRWDLPGPALWCCGHWVQITHLPLVLPCCDRRVLVETEEPCP